MRYTPAILFGAALLCLAAGGTARADHIEWFYSWSRTPDTIYADGSTASFVTLSDASEAKNPGAANIVATNMHTYGESGGAPAIFSPKPYTLTLTIWDKGSPTPGSVSFSGELFGYLTASNAHIQSFFTGALTKTVVLADHLYTITLAPNAPATADCSTGQVTAIATVTVQSLPEPTALVLAGLALPGAALVWMRRRRPAG